MRRLISIIILCIGILTNADAQTFTQRIQKQVAGQGSITIRQDSVIDQLVNSATLGIKSSGQAAKPSQTSSTSHTSTSSPSSSTSHTSTTSHTSSTSPTTTSAIPDTIDTSKKIMRGMKITGYRVQVFAGGNSRADRQKAERIRDDIKAHFSTVPVYAHFYSPRWICRVGNYRTYEEAHQMLVTLRNIGYTQATIVKGKITVAY
ncbi:MAG: SPOR domain-containing protein [Prevotella sp.]|nr:SPOR domain-containing protein [Prevotella sp.]